MESMESKQLLKLEQKKILKDRITESGETESARKIFSSKFIRDIGVKLWREILFQGIQRQELWLYETQILKLTIG